MSLLFGRGTKNKRVFPNDNAIFKQFFLTITKRGFRWTSKTSQWEKIRNQLQILFEERIGFGPIDVETG